MKTIEDSLVEEFRKVLDESDVRPEHHVWRERMHGNPHHCQYEEFDDPSGEFSFVVPQCVWDQIQCDVAPLHEISLPIDFEWENCGVVWDCTAEMNGDYSLNLSGETA